MRSAVSIGAFGMSAQAQRPKLPQALIVDRGFAGAHLRLSVCSFGTWCSACANSAPASAPMPLHLCATQMGEERKGR